jgi:hypothetical protein
MDSESDDGSDVEGFYDAIPEHTMTYKTCRDAMADNGALMREIDEKNIIIARLAEGKLALTAEYHVIHEQMRSNSRLIKNLLDVKRNSISSKDQLKVVIQCFLSVSMETDMDTHQHSSKHLLAESGILPLTPYPCTWMYPYMIFEAKDEKYVIVAAVNKKDTRVWSFKVDQYKDAMKMARLARVDPADIRERMGSTPPYKWFGAQPDRAKARGRAREMMQWADPVFVQRSYCGFADTARLVVKSMDARAVFKDDRPAHSMFSDKMVVTAIEPDGEWLAGRLHGEDDVFEWKDGDFEYASSSEQSFLFL